jgi:hypothetical protein
MFRVELGCGFKVTRRFSRKHERCTISGLQILRCDLCLRATGGIWILLFNVQLFFVSMILLNIMCEAMNPAAQKLRSTRATVTKAKLEIPARFSSQLWMRISKLLQRSSVIKVDSKVFAITCYATHISGRIGGRSAIPLFKSTTSLPYVVQGCSRD